MTTLKVIEAIKLFYLFVRRKIAAARIFHPGTDCGPFLIDKR